MKFPFRTLRAIAGLAVALSLYATPAFAKPGDKHQESDDEKRSPSDPRTEQLQEQIKALQKQLDAIQKSAAKEAPKARKEEKWDKDEPKKGEAKAKPGYKKTDAAAGPHGKGKKPLGKRNRHQKLGRAASAAVMVPVGQLPPGIAKRFNRQRKVSSSLLPPGIARKFTGAGDDKKKEKDQAAGRTKPAGYEKVDGRQKSAKSGGHDNDDEKTAKAKRKK